MSIDREKILAFAAGFAIYLLFGSTLEHFRGFIDSMVVAELISRVFKR
jgi:hypothetical protein